MSPSLSLQRMKLPTSHHPPHKAPPNTPLSGVTFRTALHIAMPRSTHFLGSWVGGYRDPAAHGRTTELQLRTAVPPHRSKAPRTPCSIAPSTRRTRSPEAQCIKRWRLASARHLSLRGCIVLASRAKSRPHLLDRNGPVPIRRCEGLRSHTGTHVSQRRKEML